MKTFNFSILIALIGFLGYSCSDDNNYSLGNIWVATGTVVKTTDYFYVVIDDGSTLWPSASNVSPDRLDDGMRTYVSYTILGDANDNEAYDYYVKINGMSQLLTKPVFNFDKTTSQHVKDSIGSDAITITDTWFTNDYLNIQFEYGGGPGYVHFINLVKNTEDLQTENGEIILELMHNKNRDPYNYLQWSIASFDISELKVPEKNTIDIFIRSIDKEGNYQYNKVLTYNYEQPNIEPVTKVFSSTPISVMLK